MAKSKQTRQRGGKKSSAEERLPSQSSGVGGAELEELDAFIEKVLEEAGEEFLDEFRQIEGE